MTRNATLRRGFPTLILLGAPLRWIGKSRRRIWTTALLALAVLGSGPAWWAMQLIGLPDIGDPFDEVAFQTSTVGDDRNAFVLYDQAATLFKAAAGYPPQSNVRANWMARWPEAAPELRLWADDNREALAVYRQGAERPDARDSSVGPAHDRSKTLWALSSLRLVVLLEASRLEEQGDMASAWGWYRAHLRTIHHIGMRGAISSRNRVVRWHGDLRNRLMTWADDPKTTPALLRRALDDVVACEDLVPSESDSIKSSYLDVMALLDSTSNPGQDVPLQRFRRFWSPNYTLSPELIQSIWDAWRTLRREPERSRRVVRLMVANWLAYLELPAASRPQPDARAASLELYSLGPESPAQGRILSPESLDGWFDTAHDARQVLHYLDGRGVQTVERENHVDLLVLLATALYHRDHGTGPPTPDALVGPYLKSLPAEYIESVKGRSDPASRSRSGP